LLLIRVHCTGHKVRGDFSSKYPNEEVKFKKKKICNVQQNEEDIPNSYHYEMRLFDVRADFDY